MCEKRCRSIIKEKNNASSKRKKTEKKEQVQIGKIILKTFKRNQIQVVLLGNNGELLGTGMGELQYSRPMY